MTADMHGLIILIQLNACMTFRK